MKNEKMDVTFLVNAKFLNLMQIFTGKSKTYIDVAFSTGNNR